MNLNKEKWLTSFGIDKSPKSHVLVLKLMRQLFSCYADQQSGFWCRWLLSLLQRWPNWWWVPFWLPSMPHIAVSLLIFWRQQSILWHKQTYPIPLNTELLALFPPQKFTMKSGWYCLILSFTKTLSAILNTWWKVKTHVVCNQQMNGFLQNSNKYLHFKEATRNCYFVKQLQMILAPLSESESPL